VTGRSSFGSTLFAFGDWAAGVLRAADLGHLVYSVNRPLGARAKDPTAVGAAPRRGLVRSGSFAGSRERVQAGPPAQ
jgi:hypothetical protein